MAQMTAKATIPHAPPIQYASAYQATVSKA